MMHVDSFLKIGHSHTMCQDYILSGVSPFPYIILSDGCSSAADSDIGARLLCHAALQSIMRNSDKLDSIGWSELGYATICDAKAALDACFVTLPIECLDATLIVAFKTKYQYRVFMYGDGCLYFVQPDEQVNYDIVRFTPNAPAYLRYMLCGKEQYEKNNIKMHYVSQRHNIVDSYFDADTPFQVNIPNEQVKLLVVASDGIESLVFKEEALYKTKYLKLYELFMRFNTIAINLNAFESKLVPQDKELKFFNILNEVSDFKLVKGPFLSRRIKKVLKEYAKNGFVNDDDLSIGCFLEG